MRPICIDCGKIIKMYGAKRCRKCYNKLQTTLKGLLAHNWKGGLPKCIDCGKEICRGCKRCVKCYGIFNKKENHSNWKGDRPICVDCGKEVSGFDYKRCRDCNSIKRTKESRENAIRRCKVCNKQIKHASKLCKSCYEKENGPGYKHKHHIDLDKNNGIKQNLLILNRRKHKQLHQNGYAYLVITGQIFDYLKWFNKTFGLKNLK